MMTFKCELDFHFHSLQDLPTCIFLCSWQMCFCKSYTERNLCQSSLKSQPLQTFRLYFTHFVCFCVFTGTQENTVTWLEIPHSTQSRGKSASWWFQQDQGQRYVASQPGIKPTFVFRNISINTAVVRICLKSNETWLLVSPWVLSPHIVLHEYTVRFCQVVIWQFSYLEKMERPEMSLVADTEIFSRSVRCHWATWTFSSLQRLSIKFGSGDWLGHSRTMSCFLQSLSLILLAVCFGV